MIEGSGLSWSYLPARRGLKWYRGDPARLCDVIVNHCTQGTTANGAANWFQNPNAGGSAHITIDDQYAIRSAHDTEGTYHTKGHNGFSLGLEIAGFAEWDSDTWLSYSKRVTEAARINASWCRTYNIRPEPAVIRSGKRRLGVTFHREAPGNDHWDPGPNFPYDLFWDKLDDFYRLGTDHTEYEWPPPKDGSLRLAASDVRFYAGWDECLGPMRWIAKKGLSPESGVEWTIAWSGSIWKGPQAVTYVCINLVKRVDRYQKTGEWK